MKRYLSLWMAITGVFLAGVAAVNAVVDPYGVVRLVDKPGFNQIKPAAGAHGAVSKAYQMLRVRPRTLLLGNSRAEVGLDPAHPALSARPVYNAALPGTGTQTSLRYLQHLLAETSAHPQAPPMVVIWGIDFMDFLTDPELQDPVPLPKAEEDRLRKPGTADHARWQQQTRDYLTATLTLSALLDTALTLASQQDVYAAHVDPMGFNPMRDYLPISAAEGYWSLFRQRDYENVKAYMRRPNRIFDASGATSSALNDLRELVRLCRQHGIALHLYTYPYHAHLLEIIRLTGHWSALEDWKRTLAQLLLDEAQSSGRPAFELWDFSTFNTFTTEPVPLQGDRTSRMRWYWEAGHFKSELGNLMLDRMVGESQSSADMGVRLSPANVQAHIEEQRALGAQYRVANPGDVQAVESLLAQLRNRSVGESRGPETAPTWRPLAARSGARHAQIQ